MKILGLDHLVLCVRDVAATLEFYERVLGVAAREERPGKWSLHVGNQKISLQDAATAPAIARDTLPGSGNFCLLTHTPVVEVVAALQDHDVAIVAGPGERLGATGPISSVYFHDPDGNLVEVGTPILRDGLA